MATTRLIAMHQNKGKSIAQCLGLRMDYAKNPEKTEAGQLLSAYQCDARTAQGEFVLAKSEYEHRTGRRQNNNVIAYQIRQSFKPGELTAELANEIGYQLGLKFTKGKHAFIVATHTDKAHIHNHIIFNSTSLDCRKKFRDFLGSGRAVAKVSDLICMEHGLSIVENPKRQSEHYGRWLGNKKVVSGRQLLQNTIDDVLAKQPANFQDFLAQMTVAGYEIQQGKHLAFKKSQQKKFIRLRSLDDEYFEENIRSAIAGKPRKTPGKQFAKPQKSVNLLVDIEAKIQSGKGKGYEQWAKVFNLKQMAQTLNFLREHNLTSYEDLAEKAEKLTVTYDNLSKEIKSAEKRMAEIQVLKNHIINYLNTKDVYTAYRKSGYSKKFFTAHEADLILHKNAKVAFDKYSKNGAGDKKLPTIKALHQEYSAVLATKKKAYGTYKNARKEMQEILTAKANIDRILDVDTTKKSKEKSQDNTIE